MAREWKILDLIQWIKKLTPFLPLLQFPNWENSEDVRQWAIKALGVLDDYAAETETKIDDALVDFGQLVTSDAETWGTLYSLIWDVIAGDTGGIEGDHRITALADDTKIDPAIIVLIINAVIELIKWWQDRNNPTTENID